MRLVETFGINDDNTLVKDQQPIVVLNFIEGEIIMDIIHKKIKAKTLDRAECFRQMLKMAETIDYLHSSLFMMHRDLHVMNWMITSEGEPVITDFGLGLELGEGGYTERGAFTPHLSAPEQYLDQTYSFNADVW